jgi:hypothetical protein
VKAGLRRTIGSIACLLFLVFWICACLAIADRLPDTVWIRLVFFAVAGLGWGVPLFPLIAWANKPDPS